MEEIHRSTRIVGFVLPVDGDRVLLARHTNGPPVWALLGGTALPDEAPDAAARREVKEESGLLVTTDRLVAVCNLVVMVMFVFIGWVIGGSEHRQPDEIAQLRWLRRDQLADEPVFQMVPLVFAALFDSQDGPRCGTVPADAGAADGTSRPAYIAGGKLYYEALANRQPRTSLCADLHVVPRKILRVHSADSGALTSRQPTDIL